MLQETQTVHSFSWAQEEGSFHVRNYEWAVTVVTTVVRGTLVTVSPAVLGSRRVAEH